MKHGEMVSAFEREFAAVVGAKYAIAVTNGTVSLEIALLANGISEGSIIHTTPLTMAATTIAILNAGGVPKYEDVDPDTWLMKLPEDAGYCMPVSLYGLGVQWCGSSDIDDAAQTLRKHSHAAFTSYSLQRSKILNTGEGGVLVTDSELLATEAREIASLGYKLGATQSRIDSHAIKSSDYARHHRKRSLNARMNDITAAEGLKQIEKAEWLVSRRVIASLYYKNAIEGCTWVTPQACPEGYVHDRWCYAIATDTPEQQKLLSDAVVRHGGERPYSAWLPTYMEPAFKHLGKPGLCPVAESLQKRILQFQTNDLASAERNAGALRKAIEEIG